MLPQNETLQPRPDQTLEASLLPAMKLFHRFRKFLMRLVFFLPSGGSSGKSSNASSKQNNSDRFDPPKLSCSSYYSSHSHYTEAIADCRVLQQVITRRDFGGSKI
ncbi:WEB family protein [Hibiscus syriacus]|uniref:WEB family protein n=1 Tax=Hibiscus syriacus TaxID=106335 RepID=A0A6A3BGL8_HIBSY|nr:WEB family protein [Hibiscus syriacus]